MVRYEQQKYHEGGKNEMKRKLLKKIALYAMTAAMCAGVLAPMKAEAASRADVIGTWKGNGPAGDNIFYEDGTAEDRWNRREYHMQSGTITVTWKNGGGTATLSYDLWRGETISLSNGDDACVYKLNGDTMTCWNIFNDGGTVYSYDQVTLKRAGKNDSESKSRKSAAEKEAEEKEKAEKEKERKALEQASREAVRLEGEAAKQGFANAAQMQEAKAENKTADEYYNNAAVTAEGIENAVPVAQGGKLVVDGKVTNMTATISKVTAAYVDSVKAAVDGTLLNVVDVQFPATEAKITFYMPGVKEGDAITAVQYVDGTWIDVEVAEVRADHVVLNLKGNGVVAFILK